MPRLEDAFATRSQRTPGPLRPLRNGEEPGRASQRGGGGYARKILPRQSCD